VFNELRDRKEGISNRRVFTEAGGKDITKDQAQTSKNVTSSKSKYKRVGANKIDLIGVDTKDVFVFQGKQRGTAKVVKARRVKWKHGTRYIDKSGRVVRIFK